MRSESKEEQMIIRMLTSHHENSDGKSVVLNVKKVIESPR